jgi:cytochrome c
LRRELGKKGAWLDNRRAVRLLMALLIGVVLSPTASAQALRKDSNTKPMVTVSAADQTAFGKDLFRQHCASCHFAETTAQKIGPGLRGMYARPFADGKKVTDAGLTKWIESGGKNMPGFKETIKPEQVRVLIVYLKTL